MSTTYGTAYATLDISREIGGVEYPDIPVEVTLYITHIGSRDLDDGPDYQVTSCRVADDVRNYDAKGNELAGYMFRFKDQIELTDNEAADAFEKAIR